MTVDNFVCPCCGTGITIKIKGYPQQIDKCDADVFLKNNDTIKPKDNQIQDLDLKSAKIVPKFTPPGLEEISAYCKERKNKVDPEAYLSYYESVGWWVGRKRMKDWKAAVRTWEKNIIRDAEAKKPYDAVGPKRECLCGRPGRIQKGNEWFCNKCFDEKGI